MFLHTLGHNVKNRILQKKFGRSGKTVCAIIHAVLTSILRLHKTLYCKAVPVPDHCQHVNWKHFKVCSDPKLFSKFHSFLTTCHLQEKSNILQNCLGALDGTHVKVRTRIQDQPRYRNRKGDVSINVLGVCNPSGEFIYCLAGWEGSAHDARVLRGQYYLCDAGYANTEGFLAPFRGQRYHLKEWGGGSSRPRTPEEYYNMKHSSARNVIEKMFGLFKMRWAILRDTTWFSPKVVGRIVHTCCLLHNFIRQEAGIDGLERDYIQQPLPDPPSMAE
ncbi:Putative nuclease HARBI1 [Linum perenne]